ncbi:MAG: LysM peptidoglycan-binding domain-containing protein [Anaerolineae bacterium]|nr:LysM peptidoglycan-binding domain-containing protein [Anaerolineae bacterium]
MRRVVAILLIAAMLGAMLPAVVSAQETTYRIQWGDTLYRIARRFGTTVEALATYNKIVNPNLIYAGTILRIPTGTQPPPPPPPPGEVQEYTVVRGDTLLNIARRFNTTLAAILAINVIPNPNLIYPGQKIKIPGGAVVPTATSIPGVTPTSIPPGPPSVGFAYGIQVHLPGQDKGAVAAQVNDLGMKWVKQQIEWKVYESAGRGQIDFSELDAMVDALNGAGLNILFSVVKAPAWARNTTEEDGPPADFQDYANFVSALASRYKGRVQAYEIWNEQNLRREWNGRPLSAASYVQMLALAYNAIKAVDPNAIVVSGALAPTGWNDGVNAIDDRVYFQQMYAAGIAAYSDAIGAHPNGWANPPASVCCNNTAGVPTHDDHRSFFFRHTLEDYHNIMVQNGDTGTFIWATEFGWGTNADIGGSPVAGFEFVAYTDLNEQATYIVDGFAYARALNYVGPMFLWNLNFCTVVPGGEQCYWGLLGPGGTQRPAYGAVKGIPK